MMHSLKRIQIWLLPMAALALLSAPVGCVTNNPNNPTSRYPQRPIREVPQWLEDSIFQTTDLANTEPFWVSSFGLVVNLRGTGDSTAPTAVREYMMNQMVRHGFGVALMPDFRNMSPSAILRDPQVAIVRVDGAIPPGARARQRIDVLVQALETSDTSSLARGRLYRTDLRIDGANPMNPGGSVNPYARTQGEVFVNPAYALEDPAASRSARASLRNGVILNGGIVLEDRPLVLRLRQPERRLSRAIEARVNQRFQSTEVASAQDEGIIHLSVPERYHGDWEHFAGVVMHLFLNGSPEFSAMKARQLVHAALEPDAPLQNISYAWEGLGHHALEVIKPLMTHESPDVAYAAARAAAFIGDTSAQAALKQMAGTPDHPFQVSAVQVLGALPPSPSINQMLRRLLHSEQNLVRIEAYKVLAQNRDNAIITSVIDERFVLDVVLSDAAPLVYASRSGMPRIAVFGERTAIERPITFTAMGNTFSISSHPGRSLLTLFYRGDRPGRAVQVHSRPDLAEVIARLGGEGPRDTPRMNFSYSDIVGLLQALSDAGKLIAYRDGQEELVAFMLQDAPDVDEAIRAAPRLGGPARPQRDEPEQIGLGR